MRTVAGIFTSRAEAERAAGRLRALGIAEKQISILTPEASGTELNAVPTTEAEQPGMGKIIGGVAGGAAGLSGGIQAGAISGLLSVPAVGPVIAIGFAGALLAGIVGAKVGGALEYALRDGLPKDEIYFYEDALRQGRSVVIFQADPGEEMQTGREALLQAGAESLDAAREQWWIGLRDAEEAEYRVPDKSFREIEPIYRSGFEAALEVPVRGKSYNAATIYLKEHYLDVYWTEEFRRGYARGLAYWNKLELERNH